MEKRQISGMYSVFPWIGVIIGLVACVLFYFEWSSLMTAFGIVFVGILLSGGLHMDGFIDTSDAFFSYKDREKRFEILDDPRVGAFGVLSVVLLVLGKVIIVAEVLASASFHWIFVLVIPFFSRSLLVILFSLTKSAKESGLAFFFKQKMNPKTVILVSTVNFFIGFILVGLFTPWMIAMTFAAVLFIFIYLYRNWALKNFGGITGDLLGASVEVSEVVLWISLLFLL